MATRQTVSVFSEDDALVAALRAACAETFRLVPPGEPSDVVILDGDRVFDDSSSVVLRLDDGTPSQGGDGELRFSRAAFLLDPFGVIALAAGLASARVRAAAEAFEVEFAQHLRELMSAGDLATVFRKIASRAIDLARASSTTVLLHDPVTERFAVVYSSEPHAVEEGEFLPGVPADLLQSAINDESGYAVRESSGRRNALAVVPLMVGEDLIGVFTLARVASSFDAAAIDAAAAYIRSVAPLLITVHQLSKSRDLALRDDLTSAYNRRFFDAHLDEELERARRYNLLLSIIFLDLDDLKVINNQYGHLAGSRMLQEVARRILGAVRTIDKVIRFGGDEFCIVLPQTDPDQAHAVALRVRKAMGERKFTLEHHVELPMTASFGIATYPVHARTKEELIRAADAAMYCVKTTTKNAIGEAPRPDLPRAADGEPAV